MPRSLSYRKRLLAIVSAFENPDPASQTRARRLISRLYHDHHGHYRRSQTLDDLVWGGFISELTDSEFYESPTYLQTTRETLLHGSPELQRAYVSYDFRPAFTAVERDWHTQLEELTAWLRSAPFTTLEPAVEEYQRRVTALTDVAARTPPPAMLGEETLYHFILRTAAAVVTRINPYYSHRFGYLAAAPPCTMYYWDPEHPNDPHRAAADASESVAWAGRALAAITLDGWVWMTWQVTASACLVSLH